MTPYAEAVWSWDGRDARRAMTDVSYGEFQIGSEIVIGSVTTKRAMQSSVYPPPDIEIIKGTIPPRGVILVQQFIYDVEMEDGSLETMLIDMTCWSNGRGQLWDLFEYGGVAPEWMIAE